MRDAILQQATRLFAAQGYEGTSLQEIADAVGVRKPSLFYHFPSKDELRLAVLDQLLARWGEVLPRLLMAATREQRFGGVMTEMVSFFRSDPDRARLLVREVLDRPQDMTERLASYARPWIELLSEYIEHDKRAGKTHPDVDPQAYVITIINLGVSAIAVSETLQLVLPDSSDADESRQRQIAEMLRISRSSLFVSDRPSGEVTEKTTQESSSPGNTAPKAR